MKTTTGPQSEEPARPAEARDADPTGGFVDLEGERYYRIRHYDRMAPFFMTLASGSDHWLFVSSCGAVTAGRGDANAALFPYATEDKLIDSVRATGSLCSVWVARGGRRVRWEPFGADGREAFAIARTLYKRTGGSRLVFEEANAELGLVYRYGWCFSDRYGVVREASLHNLSEQALAVELLDGVRNLLPAGVTSGAQSDFSNLLDAYKEAEWAGTDGPAVYSLTSRLTDQPAPFEALLATTAWHVGLEADAVLLSSAQVDTFRRGGAVAMESRVRGARGAFLLHAALDLAPGSGQRWSIALNVEQDSAAVVALEAALRDRPALARALARDVAATDAVLRQRIAQGDGLQACAEEMVTVHHAANVMFNLMRGGIPAHGYTVQTDDWRRFVRQRNAPAADRHAAFLRALPPTLALDTLRHAADASGAAVLARLARQYLPLTFSRRHGDPTRPWNRFAIRVRNADGSPRLAYEGNWRDIFQNWEALGGSFPEYLEHFIATFLCATTADGYNPYRLTQDGIDWEVPEHDAPWSAYGYWSDHQIVYLLRLLEAEAQFYPGRLEALINRPLFSHADVPYRIKPYAALRQDPRNSVSFDAAAHAAVLRRAARMGADGRLVPDANGDVLHVTLAEKLLILLLAKLGNFVPDGGLWMNTQRPEWNDANNALAGYGLSVVTICHLRRYLHFLRDLLRRAGVALQLTTAVADWLRDALRVLRQFDALAAGGGVTERTRRAFMDAMGQCASAYRTHLYAHGPSAVTQVVDGQTVDELLARSAVLVDHGIRANRRDDGLYHAYNTLAMSDDGASVQHLQEMLEGQVAVLASGLLTAHEALAVLQALRRSAMFRTDQHSYMLYPRRLPKGFLERNRVPEDAAQRIPLLRRLLDAGDTSVLTRDLRGTLHFNGRLGRSSDVRQALAALHDDPHLAAAVAADAEQVVALFEATFNHRAYTGRSGSMFAYEGIGSIYWHMVAKLLLAAQECADAARACGAPEAAALRAAYADIRAGLGFNKPPDVFGAFPTDPHSYTPWQRGAQQPGMTGQVKEELLARWGELGLRVRAGCVLFDPDSVPEREFRTEPGAFEFLDVDGREQRLALPAHALAFTFCQTPVVYRPGPEPKILLWLREGAGCAVQGYALDAAVSRGLFARDGAVARIEVHRVRRPG